jgi:Uma2 family endonuclease
MSWPLRSSTRRIDLDDFEEMLLECPEEEKWELIDGRIVRSMVGARYSHHRIVRNIAYALERALDGKPGGCRVFTETFRLAQRFARLSALPDVMVRCGPIDPDATSVDDPVVLMEVVGPASEQRDTVVKAEQYRRLASLSVYVLIDRDEQRVSVHRRGADGLWREHDALTALADVVDIPEIGVSLTLAEIYRDISGL